MVPHPAIMWIVLVVSLLMFLLTIGTDRANWTALSERDAALFIIIGAMMTTVLVVAWALGLIKPIVPIS
jgi:hypothetical protein